MCRNMYISLSWGAGCFRCVSRDSCAQLKFLCAAAAAVQFCAYDWRVMELAVALSK
jgi:hypothetical protein